MSHASSSYQTGTCAATGRTLPVAELMPLAALSPKVAEMVRKRFPDLDDQAQVSMSVISNARLDYTRGVLEEQMGELSKLDEEVVKSLAGNEILSERPSSEAEADKTLTFGERLADKIAEVGGSWRFIIGFVLVLAVWITTNVVFLRAAAFDPYPFILLNLVLSCVAALQAPVIMMSQNRQESRDRLQAENDYKVNLKAELEIRHLHEKMDYLLHQHARRLMEIQHMQLESLRELARVRDDAQHRR